MSELEPTAGALATALQELRVHQVELALQNEELRHTQGALDASRARYFDLYDLAPVGYLTLNEKELVVEANLSAGTLLGVPRGLLLERLFTWFIAKEERGAFHQLRLRLRSESGPQSIEVAMVGEDERRFWAHLVVTSSSDEAGAPELRVVMSDVTPRKVAEAAAREVEARHRDLFSRASDGILLSSSDGLRLEANEAFARMHGWTATDLANEPDRSAFALSPAQLARLATGEVLTLELEHPHRAGHSIPVEAKVSQVSVGGVPHTLGFYRDITERKKLQAGLAQSERLASMGMLAAGISHELNNPLAYVLSNIESLAVDLPIVLGAAKRSFAALERDLGKGASGQLLGEAAGRVSPEALDDLVERTQSTREGTQRIQKISRGLGIFSRSERSTLEPVDLNRALEGALSMAHNELKFRASLIKNLGEIPRVLASEARLAQLFLNLLINAAQAIEEGHVAANRITVRTWAAGEDVFAEIADTGPGVAREHLERIFEPFFTTKEAGSGLGLSICRSIVTEFKGELRVESVPGQGTRFVLRLPACRLDTADHPTPAPQSHPGRGRVLVIDDEEQIRKTLRRVLGRAHDVVTVASGREARNLLELNQAFDVILCDLMMPDMTGTELHAWLVATRPLLAAKVIFLSGGAFTPSTAAYLASTENLQLQKPFDADGLREVVAARVNQRSI